MSSEPDGAASPVSVHRAPPTVGRALAADPELADWEGVLRRTIRALPDEQLQALFTGLEKHADDLVAGRLFRGPSGGGCAVGVMLCELDPGRFAGRGPRFWLRQRWRRSAESYDGEVGTKRRLRHLE